MVNKAMSVQGRNFHTPEHVIALADENHPHITLAALFHDIVYHHVDQGFIPEIETILRPYIVKSQTGGYNLARKVSRQDRAFWGTCAVFGFTPGQVLNPFSGMNEFLSALVMNVLFVNILSDQDLFITTPCIEATIPFRPTNEEGLSPPMVLAERLKRVNTMFNLNLPEEDIDQSVKCAVRFANRDVLNFSEADVGVFLDNTWKLLPETNPALRLQGIYTIESYRSALGKMGGFLSGLDPTRVFSQYKDEPSDRKYKELCDAAKKNLETARDYLGIKFITACILEALALASGGDAPISLFLGDLDPDAPGGKIEDYLPEIEMVNPPGDLLHSLLSKGRASESSFDLKNSPLACYIYENLGIEGCRQTKTDAESLIAQEISPEEFLGKLPYPMVAAIGQGISRMVWTRRETLENLISNLK
jgi:hypothetical protein